MFAKTQFFIFCSDFHLKSSHKHLNLCIFYTWTSKYKGVFLLFCRMIEVFKQYISRPTIYKYPFIFLSFYGIIILYFDIPTYNKCFNDKGDFGIINKLSVRHPHVSYNKVWTFSFSSIMMIGCILCLLHVKIWFVFYYRRWCYL